MVYDDYSALNKKILGNHNTRTDTDMDNITRKIWLNKDTIKYITNMDEAMIKDIDVAGDKFRIKLVRGAVMDDDIAYPGMSSTIFRSQCQTIHRDNTSFRKWSGHKIVDKINIIREVLECPGGKKHQSRSAEYKCTTLIKSNGYATIRKLTIELWTTKEPETHTHIANIYISEVLLEDTLVVIEAI